MAGTLYDRVVELVRIPFKRLGLPAKAKEMPEFEHDSRCCIFLGRYIDSKDEHFDLYFCKQSGIPTVLARWSSDEPDYYSGLPFADTNERLAEAKRRAEMRGLLPRSGD